MVKGSFPDSKYIPEKLKTQKMTFFMLILLLLFALALS